MLCLCLNMAYKDMRPIKYYIHFINLINCTYFLLTIIFDKVIYVLLGTVSYILKYKSPNKFCKAMFFFDLDDV